MDDLENTKKIRPKKILSLAGYLFLFLLSFAFFVYLTFPYEVLKESVAADLSQATGYSIRVGDLSPALPLGLKASNIEIETPSGAGMIRVSSVKVRLALLKLFLAKISPEVEIGMGKGKLELKANVSVLNLLNRQFVPQEISLMAKDFPLDEIMGFGLALVSSGPSANPMVAPIIEVIGISATLQANSQFELDTKNPTLSKGFADITLKNAVLKLDHPTLGLPNQEFRKAGIKARVEGGNVVIDKSSGLVAEELELLVDGKIGLKPDPMSSMLDLNMEFALHKGLKEKFGFVIDAVTGRSSSDGKLSMQMRGALEQPTITMF